MVPKSDQSGAIGAERTEAKFSHFKAATLSGPTIFILASLVAPVREHVSTSIVVFIVVMMTLFVLALYEGFRSMLDHKHGTFATWSVRLGRTLAWILLAVSPVAVVMAIQFPSDSPILQYALIAVGIVVCGIYQQMVRDYFDETKVD